MKMNTTNTKTEKRKMSEAQAKALAKARAAAIAAKAKAAKPLTKQPDEDAMEIMYRDISKRLEDMAIILKEIYNNMPTRLNTDWLK